MGSYAKIDDSNVVENVEVWDSNPGSGYVAIGSDTSVSIGYTYDSSTNTFSAPAKTATDNYDEAVRELQQSDWTQLSDVALTTANKAEWVTYRNALRDIARNPTAGDLTWPTKPQEVYEGD